MYQEIRMVDLSRLTVSVAGVTDDKVTGANKNFAGRSKVTLRHKKHFLKSSVFHSVSRLFVCYRQQYML